MIRITKLSNDKLAQYLNGWPFSNSRCNQKIVCQTNSMLLFTNQIFII